MVDLTARNKMNTNAIKGAIVNVIICVVVLIPDGYARFRLNQGLIPDAVVLMAFIWLLVTASTSKLLFRSSALCILILNVIYLHVVKTWGPFGLSDRLEVFLESPPYQSIEYIKVYLTFGDLKILLYAIATGFLIFQHRLLKINAKYLGTATIAVVLAATFFLPNRSTLSLHSFSSIAIAAVDASDRVAQYATRQVFVDQRALAGRSCTDDYENVVIVLGESANKNYMGIYGYPINNTPFLKRIEPFIFDAISPSNHTRLSVPLMFTRATVENFGRFLVEPSIVSELTDCGYDTHWISNQAGLGTHNRSSSTIGIEAKYKSFRDNSIASGPDELLLPKIRHVVNASSRRKAIFVHLMGSHFVYSGRYPERFPKKRAQNVTEEYVLSIHYTDHVLSKIHALFSTSSLLFIYVSDHGEAVGEATTTHDGLQVTGHGLSPSFKDEYEIPLIVWSSSPHRTNNAYLLSQGKTINTESFDQLVRYLVGLSDTPEMSYSDLVLEVSPGNVVRYSSLRSLKDNTAFLRSTHRQTGGN